MPRGDKSSYTGKQKRMAEHIEEGGKASASRHAAARSASAKKAAGTRKKRAA